MPGKGGVQTPGARRIAREASCEQADCCNFSELLKAADRPLLAYRFRVLCFLPLEHFHCLQYLTTHYASIQKPIKDQLRNRHDGAPSRHVRQEEGEYSGNSQEAIFHGARDGAHFS